MAQQSVKKRTAAIEPKVEELNAKLVTAAGDGNLSRCKKLVTEGADINGMPGSWGRSALSAALREDEPHLHVAEWLLAQGASPAVEDGAHRTVAMSLVVSQDEKKVKTLEWLLDRVQWEQCLKNDLNSPLHEAARWDNLAAAEMMLNRGISPDTVNLNGWSVLHDAAGRSEPAMSRLLLDRGANPFATSKSGWLPVHQIGTPEVAMFWKERGFDLDQEGPRQLRLIHQVDSSGSIDTFRTLLALGCNPAGCYGIKDEHRRALDEPPFVNAVMSKNPAVILTHIDQFGEPSQEHLKAVRLILTRNSELKILLDAQLVKFQLERIARAGQGAARAML